MDQMCSIENCPKKANIKCLCENIMFCETHIDAHLLYSTGVHNCVKLFNFPLQATKVASISHLNNSIASLRSLRSRLTQKLSQDMIAIQSFLGNYLSKIDYEIIKTKKELLKIMNTDQIPRTDELHEMEFLLLPSDEAIDYLNSKNAGSIKSMSHTEILEKIYKIQKNFEWRETSEMKLLAEKNKNLKKENKELNVKNQELIQKIRRLKQEHESFQEESSLQFLVFEDEKENTRCQLNTKIEQLKAENCKLSIEYNNINASYKILYGKYGKSMKKSHSLVKPGNMKHIYQCCICQVIVNDDLALKKNECGCISCQNCMLPEYEEIFSIFKKKKSCRKCGKVKSGNEWVTA
ncbi:unnamed protein product [Blepharisma stoltei]|uniref:RING-type domain-containing protein n=1 Tax=Blepharisma stoltei TaxID=1481888 RepID=A0AAU9JS79_9CILI|nr:unnamed protein product [Blepharisma stoltei]